MNIQMRSKIELIYMSPLSEISLQLKPAKTRNKAALNHFLQMGAININNKSVKYLLLFYSRNE